MSITTRKTVQGVKRLTNSTDGNPRYRVTFTDGTSAKTKTNAGFVYSGMPHSGEPVDVTIDGNGSISDITRTAL